MYRSGFDRIMLRSNIASRLNNWSKIGLNLAGAYDRRETNQYTTNSLNGGLAILALPWHTPDNENGEEYYETQIPGLGRFSPKYLGDKFPSQLKNQQFNPTAFIEITPIQNLIIKSQAGLDYRNYRVSSRRLPSYSANLSNGTATEDFYQPISRTLTNTIEYKWNLNESNRFTFLAGQEYSDYKYDRVQAYGTALTDDRLILLSNTTTGFEVLQERTEYAYNSYFGRIAYDYNSKIFINASVRQDASSRFGQENQKAT
ncbi:hypothetical protein [Sphingobacterium hungaricum]